MATSCGRSSTTTRPVICVLVAAIFLAVSHAKPLESEEHRLSQRDVQYYTTSPDYAFVTPVRLGSRHRRSTDEPDVTSTFEITVGAFDQDFHLELMGSMDLFDAGLLVKRIGADGQARVEQPTSACYHHGHVKGREDSTSVALSTCDSLVGMIRTPETDYAITPLLDDHAQAMASEQEAPTHIMYKMSPSDFNFPLSAKEDVKSRPEKTESDENERREMGSTKTAEMSILADETMFDAYGKDTEFYIFTLINQVAGLFRDKSLGSDIRLLVNSITILEEVQSDLDLTDELSHSLKNFCKWQKNQNSDVSILLTRRDLQIGGNHGVVGKAADVGGACDPERRCVIAEDQGPSATIFTIAHEVGHSLGMYHDDAESGCDNNRNIMASGNSGGSEAFQWSRCSSNDLKDFLSSSDSACLDESSGDFPAYDEQSSAIMPGYFYDALKQCQMTFGLDATVAESYLKSKDMCAELQCLLPGSSEPITNHVPVLDGTKCGSKREICVRGQCLRYASMYDCVDGVCVPEWIGGTFGACQDDCYRYRSVFCVQRSEDGSTTTLVPDETLCPEDKPAESEYCCDPVTVDGASFQVISSTCSVTCGTGVATRVIACVDLNGTIISDSQCTDERPSVTAQCAPEPCPGTTYILFYNNWGDCSVTCGQGVETRTAFCADSMGNTQALSICEAVFTSIVTEQVCSLDPCPGTVVDTFFYVAGEFGDCSVTCGSGIQTRNVSCVDSNGLTVDEANCDSLQRPATQQFCTLSTCPQTYKYVATSFGNCSESCGPGIRTRSVFCLNELNQVVNEAFCVAQSLARPAETEACQIESCSITYTYIAEAFPECTVTCGTQILTRTVSCLSSEQEFVDTSFCVAAGLTAPDSVFVCNLDPCGNYEFVVGEFGACSTTCGTGVQSRSVVCVDTDNNNNIVSNDLCPGDTPASAVLCNDGDCPSEYNYLTSAFSDCSCDGLQTRIVVCVTYANGAPIPATNDECLNSGLTMPASEQSCEIPVECIPVWQTGEWSECSVTCGTGIQTREVYCVESEGSSVRVDSSLCDAESEPDSVLVCTLDACATYSFVAENFGDCSVTCGEGVRQRNVYCYAITGASFEIVDNSLCNPEEEPPSEEICSLEPCGGVYEASDWSECSVTCELGVETRTVTCVTFKGSGVELDESECGNMTRPSTEQECYLDACPEPYGCGLTYETVGSTLYSLQSPGYPNDYPADQECSKFLQAPEGNHVQITFTDFSLEEGCDYDRVMLIDIETNSITRLCDTVELPFVYESDGPSVEVRFITDATVADRGFTGSYQAVPEDLPEYVTGEWGECSVTCGEGVETREVTCEQEGEEVDEELCAALPEPPTSRPCIEDACPSADACDSNILRVEEGTITSPNFPEQHPANLTCTNTIRAPRGKVVQINVDFFNLADSPGCNDSDVVVIQDTGSGGVVPAVFCGSVSFGPLFTSLTNEVSITFIADENDDSVGFSISFTFVDPALDICNRIVEVSGQPIYSPNYPGQYDNNEICITFVQNNNGCLAIDFVTMDISNGLNSGETCIDDLLLVEDLSNPSLTTSFCGDDLPESPWLSASGQVRVTFASNQLNTSQGYLALPSFVDCPSAFWVPLPFGNCSASCGFGNRTREFECRSSLTNELVDSSECPDDTPTAFEPCFVRECPSCDGVLTDGNGVVEFPFAEDFFLYNDECTLTITNDGGCIKLFVFTLDIDRSQCGRDALQLYDPENIYANEPFCGTRTNYQSLGNTLQLTLRAVDSDRYKSTEIYPSFGACPPYAFRPGAWEECSESCGGGTRTRDVICYNILTNTEVDSSQCEDADTYESEEECNTQECPDCYQEMRQPGVIVSPGFGSDDGYDNDLDCLYNLTNPEGECLTISFSVFDLGELQRSREICQDYVEIIDEEADIEVRYCSQLPNASIPVFYSRSSNVLVSFVTDEEDTYAGFEALVNFVDCPDFGFVVGNFSECSTTCGGGTRTRDVTCVRFSDGIEVDDEICTDVEPEDSEPCNPNPCPSCDQVLTEEGIFTSPNTPDNYEDNQECEYKLISQEGCVRITFIGSFDLGENEGPDCEEAGDYITIEDDNWEYLDTTVCGDDRPAVWRSRTNSTTLTFHSDEEDTYAGFTAYFAFVDCPRYGFLVGEFSECDVTCGRGTQIRRVLCSDLTTGEAVSDSLCTDPRPNGRQECRNEPCPVCGETYTIDRVTLQSSGYEVNLDCTYNVTSLEGQCLGVFVLSWDLTPPTEEGECKGDTLTFVDAEYPYRVITICGQDPGEPREIKTYGSTGIMNFNSDDEDQPGDYQVFFRFQECQEYGYTVIGYDGECSTTCGEGYRARIINCTRLATGETVSDDNCNIEEYPSPVEKCDNKPCPVCYTAYNASTAFASPNSPLQYDPNTLCVYDFIAPDDDTCWRLDPFFLDIQQSADGYSCPDGLYIEDVGFPPADEAVVCGNELVDPFFSLSNHVRVVFYSDDETEGFGFSGGAFTIPCPEYAYVPGPPGECSVTCGLGVVPREAVCFDVSSQRPTNASFCTGEVPDFGVPCYPTDCPSCNQYVNESGVFINSPNWPDNYENNQNCFTYIEAPEDMCVNLFVISLEMNEEPEGGCFLGDFLSFVDPILTTPPYFDVDQVYCGSQSNIQWTSNQYFTMLQFFSNDEDTYAGYRIFTSFVECPRYIYLTTPFGECSVTCGLGVRSRTTFCFDRESNYTLVPDELCADDVRPIETFPCYEAECIECDVLINETNINEVSIITSPNFPDNYPANARCEYELYTEVGNCWEIDFDVFEIDTALGCLFDSLTAEDLVFTTLEKFAFCNPEEANFTVTTLSNNVRLTFSVSSPRQFQGFNASVQPVPCTGYTYIAGEYGECSTSCESGVERREVNCLDLATRQVVSDSFCDDERPDDQRMCYLGECPSCDLYIDETSQTISSPNYPEEYDNNQECDIEITAPEGMCVNLFFITFELEESRNVTGCLESDSLTVSNSLLESEPFYDVDQQLCGSLENVQWTSNSNNVSLHFETNSEDTFDGYQIFSSFVECPRYQYRTTPFSECSVTCGYGLKSREVYCVDTESNSTAVPDSLCSDQIRPVGTLSCDEGECVECSRSFNSSTVIRSPRFPEDYPRDQECIYDVSGEDQCWFLFFNTLDIPDCGDGLLIEELDYPTVDPTLYCGETVGPGSFYTSLSGRLRVTFTSNGTIAGIGYSISFFGSTCPEFAFIPEEYGECSVTCGEGVETREVPCLNLTSGLPVSDDDLCPGEPPSSSRPCDLGECPSCDAQINFDGQLVQSANYPGNYDNNQECNYYSLLTIAQCYQFTFQFFELEEPGLDGGCYETDYFSVSEVSPSLNDDALYVFCGNQTGLQWTSHRLSRTALTFQSNEEDTFGGYELVGTSTPCPDYVYSVTRFEECSASCGWGTQSRTVSCVGPMQRNVSVELCAGQLLPPETLPCYSGECPSCDQYINTTGQMTQLDSPYARNLECEYTFENPTGNCLSFVFASLVLPPPDEEGECEGDYLMYEEEGEYGREIEICGNVGQAITSRYSEVSLTFESDRVDDENTGFSFFNGFVPCPTHGFVVYDDDFSECDVTCGGGVQARNVTCVDLETGEAAADGECSDPMPARVQSCNDEPCETCDLYINKTGSISKSGDDYQANDECNYQIALDTCVYINMTLDLGDDDDDDCEEYIEIRDQSPGAEHLTEKFCGSTVAEFYSRSGNVAIRFVTDDSVDGSSFDIDISSYDCPEQGYIAGNYSECSVTCGEGVRTRDVTCVALVDGIPGAVLPDANCTDERPDDDDECELEECPSCDRNFTLVNTLSFSSPNPYPYLAECVDTVTTTEGSCIIAVFTRIEMEPSEDCLNDSLTVADPFKEEVSFEFCGSVVPVPAPIYTTGNVLTLTLSSNEVIEGSGYSAIANSIECPNVTWVAEDVGSCSVTCGGGFQQRNVYCRNNGNMQPFAQEGSCPGERPEDQVPCNLADCPQECGLVFTNLQIAELTSPGYPNHLYENDLDCANIIINFAGCIAITINQIDIEYTSDCSNDYLSISDSSMPDLAVRLCGNVVPTNNLWVSSAISPVSVGLITNEAGQYPGYNLTFNFVTCPRQGFTVGSYGECSVTCGTGVISRTVTCEDANGNLLSDEQCWGQRPLSEEPCYMDLCYNYVAGNWSGMCNATCGDAYETRIVSCLSDNGTVVNSTLCDQSGSTLPETTRSCNLTECLIYAFVTGDFGECSVTCGTGVQTRNVTCQDQFGGIAADSLCSDQPAASQPCVGGSSCSVVNATCNNTISNTTTVFSGNVASEGYPSAAPAGSVCPITFEIPTNNQYVACVVIEDFSCTTGAITFTGDVSGVYRVCDFSFTLPANFCFGIDSRVVLEFTESGPGGAFSGTWEYNVL